MLESKNVVKRYGRKAAVDHLSFRLEEGHIYGMLGPNGSGKSTWMKMTAGLIVPNEGEICLNQIPVGTETKKHIAYMSTEPFYYSFMTIRTVGSYYNDFFEDFDRDRFEMLVGRMNLDMGMKVSDLSTGMSAKLKIAATLSRRAQVYLLDEPLNGIDLLARDEIMQMILECMEEKCIMIISSHLVEELETIVDTVLFIRKGELALYGDVDEIRERNGKSIADMYREIFREYE